MSGKASLALLIPAYNAASHLPRLLTSATEQSEPFDEIWVYDDASTDDTALVAERLGARVLRGTVNRGCSAGKNALAQQVSATWLHFHDADDELLPNFVRLARAWIARSAHDVVLFAFEERDEATGELLATHAFDNDALSADPRAYAICTQINAICGLYRREAYWRAGGYEEDPLVLFNEDVAFHIRLAFAGLSFAAEPEVSIVNHRRRDSMSAANQLRCIRAHYHVLRKTSERAGAESYFTDIAHKLWKAAGVLGAYLDWDTADAAVALAQQLAPSHSEGSAPFRSLAALSPALALRLRERLIRMLRPRLRSGYPTTIPAGPA